MLCLALFVLLTASSSTQFQEFQDLEIGGPYSNWSTNGRLNPTVFRVVLDEKDPPPAIRVSVTSEKVSVQNPLTVNVIRGKTVHNIALPRIQSNQGKKYVYWLATDTLCDDDRSVEQLGQPVFLSVASSLPSDFRLRVKPAYNFNYDKPFSVQASPSESRYFMYTFPDDVEKVDIRAYSDSETCARLIVRRTNCPLFDGSGIPEFSDIYFYQTFTKFAGFAVSKSEIGSQFHFAFTVMSDDLLCDYTQNSTSANATFDYLHRDKYARISITPVIDQTFVSVFPLLLYVVSIIIVLLVTYFKYRLLDRYDNNEPGNCEENEVVVIVDKAWLFEKPHLIVSHKEYQKQRLVKDSKYFNFLFFQIFGALLPALTTLFQHHQQSSNKQNLDVCYLNYLCSLKMFHFNSLNSVASVSSFAIIGILNLIVVFRKKIFCYQVPRVPTTHGIQQRDAPKVVCLLGYVAFGSLSVVANNCLDKTMEHLYIYTCMWILFASIMWIYSKRHGVRKWQQFYIIAVSSAFVCLTFAEDMFDNTESSRITVRFWFLILTMATTLYFCYQYYFERPSGLSSSQWIPDPCCSSGKMVGDGNGIYQPLRSKVAYVIIAISFTFYCSFTTFTDPSKSVGGAIHDWGKNFAGLYFFYYIIQKIRFERSSFTARFKIVSLALILVFILSRTMLHFFLVQKVNTLSVSISPAKSRELNQECLLPGIDWNDIRNYMRSLSWFIFVIMMDYIDSNIKNVPKENIFVF